MTLLLTRLLRIGEGLIGGDRRGLDDMLEGEPLGFATGCDPLGWFVFQTTHAKRKV